MRATTPPATPSSSSTGAEEEAAIKSSLLMMGFPSRIVDPAPTLCACHSRPTRGGYNCSRCASKVCSLPTACPACGLTLILSTHLARSYHHLFPLQNWSEVSWSRATHSKQKCCFGCQAAFPENPIKPHPHDVSSSVEPWKTSLAGTASRPIKPKPNANTVTGTSKDGVSESGRYECGNCGRFFCIDCDVFSHEVVHNCPGCQSREGALAAAAAAEEPRNGRRGSEHNGEMDLG